MNALPSASPRLRAALVGLGRIGFGFHAPEIARHPGFAFVGVTDPLPERRREASEKWNAPAFESLAALLAETRPQVLIIASPTTFHAEHARAAFAHGAHVFCDKPVVCTVAEFDSILESALAAKRKFLAYQPARLQPEVRALQEVLRRGVLGEVYLIKRARCSYERRRDWQAFRAHGGGLLNNYGAHCLDELLAVLDGAPMRTVFCQTRCAVTAGDAEDVVKAVLVSARGLMIDLDISQACALPGPPWQVFGSRGAAVWDDATRVWRLKFFESAAAPPLVAQSGLAAEGRLYTSETLPWREETLTVQHHPAFDYYDAAWRYFAHDRPAPVTAEDSRRLLELIERCRRSAESGATA